MLSTCEAEWPVPTPKPEPGVFYIRVPNRSKLPDQAVDALTPDKTIMTHDRLKFGVTKNLQSRTLNYTGDGGVMAFHFELPRYTQARCVEMMIIEEFATAVARVAGRYTHREYLDRERAAKLLGVPRELGYPEDGHCSARAWLTVAQALFERAVAVAQKMFPDDLPWQSQTRRACGCRRRATRSSNLTPEEGTTASPPEREAVSRTSSARSDSRAPTPTPSSARRRMRRSVRSAPRPSTTPSSMRA